MKEFSDKKKTNEGKYNSGDWRYEMERPFPNPKKYCDY